MRSSIRMRSSPSDARRKPNGSLLPLGRLPTEKIPASVSRRSATARMRPGRRSGQLAPGLYRQILFFYCLGDTFGLAVQRRVIKPDAPLQLGKLADHFGQQIRLGEACRAFDDYVVLAELSGQPGCEAGDAL